MKHVDKLLHLAVGFVLTVFFGLLVHPAVGLAVNVVVMAIKEALDRRNPAKHTYDGWDAYAGVVGAVPAQWVLAALAVAG